MRTTAVLSIVLAVALGGAGCSQDRGSRQVIEINDHLTAFYDGRDPDLKRYSTEWNWVDDGAMKLGVATYAIHKGDQALVYDTFTSVDQARWARDHLKKKGVKRFVVVLSHWHPDHVGGNAVYQDSAIIASDVGRNTLARLKKDLEEGKAFGPPGIKPLILPNIGYRDRMDLYVGDIKVELHNLNIHSPDSTVIVIPSDKILLAGDTLEDSVTFMVEIADLPEHVRNLRNLKFLKFDRIYPNHGDPKVIASGGYKRTFIDATTGYITRMVLRSQDRNYLNSPLENYIGESVKKGWISLYEPYREVHADNLKAVHKYWGKRKLPEMR
jgi:glyoxylase-like metal-dependent hydrolase (beta-lactamase superfamily II)